MPPEDVTAMDGESKVREGNLALRALLEEAGVSNGAFARAVVAAGAEDGVHVGTNTTSVKRMLCGAQPRWPVPRLVAKVLSRRLRREVSITGCGFADQSSATDDRHDGLRSSATLAGTVRTVVELSGHDMDRRKFLQDSRFAAAAFSETALLALTLPPAESAARVAGRRIGAADIEILVENITHMRRLDHRFGSGRVREQVVQLLHHEASAVMRGSYSERTGKALFGALAQVSWLAGSMASDVGRQSLAQRYYIRHSTWPWVRATGATPGTCWPP
jgi:hypothetical protein